MTDDTRILLVEDNPHDRTLIKRSLEKGKTRTRVEEISSQQQLDDILDGPPPDLVITDYRLGWSNGVAVLEAFKGQWPSCPVIMFTVMGSEEIAVEAMKAGLDDYVLKSPSQFARLPEIVKGILDRKSQETALQKAEERYRTLFEGIPIGLFRVKAGGEILEVNQALLDILGYPDFETLLNTNANHVYVNPTGQIDVLDMTSTTGVEIQLQRYDRSIIDAKLYSRRVQDASGEVIYYEGSVEDITVRKQTEREREHLLEIEKKRADELATLTSVATMVTSTLDIGQILKMVAEQMTRLFSVDSCTIARWDEKAQMRQLLVEHQAVPLERDISDLFIPHKMGAKWPKTSSVIELKQPMQVHTTDPDLLVPSRAYFDDQDLKSVLMLPLTVKDQVTGILELEMFSEVRVFTEQEISLAKTLCQQVTVALENARLFDKTNRQLKELEVLHAITTFAVEAQDENQFLEYCTNMIGSAYNWHIFGVLLLDEEEGVIKSHPSYISGTTSQLQVPVGIGITGEVAKTGTPLYVPDTSVHENYLNFNVDTKAEYCVPLKINEKVIGVLNAESKEEDGFSPGDQQVLITLANQISLILERIRAQALEYKHVRQLEILNVLGSQMTGLYTRKELYSTVCERLVDKFGYYCCAILSVNHEEEYVRLEYLAGGNFSENIKPGEFTQSMDIGLIGEAVRKKEPILSNNIEDSPRFENWGDENIISEIEIPLVVDDAIIGVLMISEDRQNAFLPTDVSALKTIADQLAMGLEKTQLFETESTQRRNAELLRQVATMLSNTIDMDQRQILELILQKLKDAVDYNSATVFLIEGDHFVARAHFGIPNVVTTGEFKFSLDENKIMDPVVNKFETRLCKDVRLDPDWILVPDAEDISSWIAAPLIVRQHCVGVLTVDDIEVDKFSESDAEMVAAMAGHAANAIENSHLFNEISDALEREQQLNLIAHQLSEGMQSDEVINEVVVLACQAVGSHAGSLALISQDGQSLEFKYGYNMRFEPGAYRIKRGRGVSWEVIETSHSMMFRNYHDHSRALSDVEVEDIRALIVVPVHAGEKIIGAFGVYSYSDDVIFSHRDLELIETVGRQMGVAIYNSQLYNQTVLALEREQQLNEITRIISNTLEPQSILEKVGQHAVELVGGTGSSILLFDRKTMEPVNLVAYNSPSGVELGVDEKSHCVCKQVAETRESLLIKDYQAHPQVNKKLVKAGVEAAIIVPIVFQESVIGVLSVYTDDTNSLFSQREVELIESVGRQAGVAMNNAELFAETIQRSKELSTLYEFALATGSILDFEALLEQLQQKVNQLLSPDSFRVLLHDQESEEFEIVMAMVHGAHVKKIEGKQFAIEKGGLMGWILRNHEPLLINDTETEELPEKPLYTILTGRSYLGVPLLVHDSLVGAMIVQAEAPNAFAENDSRVLESLASQVAIALENAQLYEELEESFVQTVLALANAMDARDNYTRDHSQRISLLAVEVGRALGFSDKELENLRWAGLLHDIGKIGVPDDILLKPDTLTDEEYEIIKQHPVLGANILEPVKKLVNVAPLVRGHQEWYNGGGYPDGLAGEDIPRGARILSVVDSYIAMTDERVYRSARSHDEALRELINLKGVQFDPEVVDTFVKLLKKSSFRRMTRRGRLY